MRGCKRKAGHLGSLFFVKKKTPAQSLRECSNDEKKSYLIQPDAKVRKIYNMTKFSYKNLDFVKSTLQK